MNADDLERRPAYLTSDGEWARTCARYLTRVVAPELKRRFGSDRGVSIVLEADERGQPKVVRVRRTAAVEARRTPGVTDLWRRLGPAPRLEQARRRQERVRRDVQAVRQHPTHGRA